MKVREIVKEKYGEAARRVIEGKGLPADCCSQTSCPPSCLRRALPS